MANINAVGDLSVNGVQMTSTVLTTQPDWNGIVLTGGDLTAVGIIGANPEATLYPDGSVVGSSDNGSFTKYANGDLVMYNTISILIENPTVVLYPIELLSNSHSVSITANATSAKYITVTTSGLSFTGRAWIGTTGAATTANSWWNTKGRWK